MTTEDFRLKQLAEVRDSLYHAYTNAEMAVNAYVRRGKEEGFAKAHMNLAMQYTMEALRNSGGCHPDGADGVDEVVKLLKRAAGLKD